MTTTITRGLFVDCFLFSAKASGNKWLAQIGSALEGLGQCRKRGNLVIPCGYVGSADCSRNCMIGKDIGKGVGDRKETRVFESKTLTLRLKLAQKPYIVWSLGPEALKHEPKKP